MFYVQFYAVFYALINLHDLTFINNENIAIEKIQKSPSLR